MRATARRVGPRFLAMAAACGVIGTASIYLYGVKEGLGAFSPVFRHLPWVDMWIRWDSRWYQRIATEGYSYSPIDQSSVAFFPLYPLLIRAVSLLGIDPFIAGILITAVSGFLAVCLFQRWAAKVAPEAAGAA